MIALAAQGARAPLDALPAAVRWLLAIGAMLAWLALHSRWLDLSRRVGRLAGAAIRAAVGFAALYLTALALQSWLTLATDWPVWGVALGAAAAVEAVLALYAVERSTVSPAAGRTIAVLRVGAALLLCGMLCQPVLRLERREHVRRFVAVLLDGSASMQVPDTGLTVSQRVRIAEVLAAEGIRRPYRLEDAAGQLTTVRDELAAAREWLSAAGELDEAAGRERIAGRREELERSLSAAQETVRQVAGRLAEPLAGDVPLGDQVRRGLSDLQAQLAGQVSQSLQQAVLLVSAKDAADPAAQRQLLSEAVAQAEKLAGGTAAQVSELAAALDEAYYASLPEEERARIESIAGQTRLELARQLLLAHAAERGYGRPEDAPLLERLKARYGVRTYVFASRPSEAAAAMEVLPVGTEDSAGTMQTDMAAALEAAARDLPGGRLGGILLLTDGRHNAPRPLAPLARRLGLERVPVCSIAFGCDQGPRDAAVVSVEAPDAAYVGDRIGLRADLKLDGLAGKDATVTLSDGDKVVDSQTIRVPTQQFRTRAELAAVPAETGMHLYRVRVEGVSDEVLSSNNELPAAVSVTDQRTHLLVVEGRPRWEYRYLKNLFSGRDRTVQLQSVLLEPERIGQQPEMPRVAASVSRPAEQPEATALPEAEAEWLKFDAIVVGDVGPEALGLSEQAALRRFVVDRGGTLVVIAGPQFMPHAFSGTPLEDLLPVRFERPAGDQVAAPEAGYHVALTEEGKDHPIMQQKADPDENAAFWASLPEMDWRYPVTDTKPGASVLAYALPLQPGGSKGEGAAAGPPASAVDRDYERSHALIAVQNVGLGRVVFLASDRTWRLRYRAGDVYHHRFWGQVLRWATANKLPAGTDLVRLGTDRPRYGPHSHVQVRAMALQPDGAAVVSDELAAVVYAGDRLVLRMGLDYAGDVPGLYSADLGELPSGTYRVELDGPPLAPLLQAGGVTKVAAEFSVESSTPLELVELSADRGLLGQLAELTGGVVVDPPQAARALAALGPGVIEISDRRERRLWDSVPFLIMMVCLVTAEWVLRKRAGLP